MYAVFEETLCHRPSSMVRSFGPQSCIRFFLAVRRHVLGVRLA